MKRYFFSCFCGLIFTIFSISSANADIFGYDPIWEIITPIRLNHLIYDKRAKIISTNATSWPDGSSGQTIYLIGNDNTLYRCVNYKNQRNSDSGDICYKLKR